MHAAHAQAVARLTRVVEGAVAEVDLTPPQYRFLVFLSAGPSAASPLARGLAVSRPSLTALADGLVQRGLVERHPNADDRRQVDHTLTDAGRSALAVGDEAVQRRLGGLLSRLPPAQRRRACDGLELWLAALDAARAERLAAR